MLLVHGTCTGTLYRAIFKGIVSLFGTFASFKLTRIMQGLTISKAASPSSSIGDEFNNYKSYIATYHPCS